MKIQVLPSFIADQIAAGEVVERPSSVVKELVENAIDANAKNIEIRIEQGGKKLIEVRDDGQGMTSEDAKLSVLRHATSKIQTIDDLFALKSFGFRGEALAAISAVSHFELLTKQRDDSIGTVVRMDGGSSLRSEAAPANKGTTIRVKDLFYPTPARLEYLKTDETEYRAILKEFLSFALAHFSIGFTLVKDGKTVFQFPPVSDLKSRIVQVLPKKIESSFIPVDVRDNHGHVFGFICASGECAPTKNHQYFFVNNRRIEDFKLSYAVREAYVQSAGIEKHLYPFFVLFLEMDPILVDVNVHPRKLEVKFSEPQDVFLLIKKSIQESLRTQNEKNFSFGNQNTKPIPNTHHAFFTFQNKSNEFHQKSWGPVSNKSLAFGKSEDPFGERLKNQMFSSDAEPEDIFNDLKLIGQVDQKYIVAESRWGIVFFDQHALHERQRFETLWNEYKSKKFQIQKLLVPQKIDFAEDAISLFHEHKKEIASLGFEIRFPTDSALEIGAIPSLFNQSDLEKIFQDLSMYFQEDRIREHSVDILMRKVLEYKACRGAVMFGDTLQKEEMKKLLDDFQTTQWRNLCPHGRPNHFFLSFDELNKKFHR